MLSIYSFIHQDTLIWLQLFTKLGVKASFFNPFLIEMKHVFFKIGQN